MSFNDRIHHIEMVTTKRPKPYATEQYERIIQLWLENRSNPEFLKTLPPNIVTRIEEYLKLKGNGPYPEPREIEDELSAWIGENKWFMDHFTKVSKHLSFSPSFDSSFK